MPGAPPRRRFARWLYHLGDRLPFLIPHIANEKTEVHLRDLRRYVRDDNGIAAHTRRMLKVPLRAAANGGHRVMLIAHSMGSVIAYDTLWELSQSERDPAHVDLLLTMGSPLGQRYIQKRIRGRSSSGARCPRPHRRRAAGRVRRRCGRRDRHRCRHCAPALRVPAWRLRRRCLQPCGSVRSAASPVTTPRWSCVSPLPSPASRSVWPLPFWRPSWRPMPPTSRAPRRRLSVDRRRR